MTADDNTPTTIMVGVPSCMLSVPESEHPQSAPYEVQYNLQHQSRVVAEINHSRQAATLPTPPWKHRIHLSALFDAISDLAVEGGGAVTSRSSNTLTAST